MTDTPEQFWTTAETARYLEISVAHLIALAKIGKVPGAWKAGKSDRRADWRFDSRKIKTYKQMRDERKAQLSNMLTVEQAAEFMRFNLETVRRLTRQGKIKAYKDDDGPRAEWRYAKEDLLAYFAKPKEMQA